MLRIVKKASEKELLKTQSKKLPNSNDKSVIHKIECGLNAFIVYGNGEMRKVVN